MKLGNSIFRKVLLSGFLLVAVSLLIMDFYLTRYMGMQQTFGGMMRVVMPLLYGILFDCVGVDAPYFVAGALVLSTITLGFGFGAIAPKAKAGAAAGT